MRNPVQVVELYQPSCINDYGVAPCTAQIGVSGQAKCYNTRATCQDAVNYDQSATIVWRYTKPTTDPLPPTYSDDGAVIKSPLLPSLRGVTTSGTRINVGAVSDNVSGFGRRASVTITLADHVYNDAISDKYRNSRSYDPLTQGTYWGRMIARNPYHANWIAIIYDGYAGQSLDEMVSRQYITTNIDGPDASGRVTITGKDPLKFVDDKRATAPMVIDAYLDNAIDNIQTSGIDIVGNEDDISKELGSTGTLRYARVNDEIVSYTGYTLVGTVIRLTGVIRGELGTDASAHAAEDAVARAIRYVDTNVWDVMYDLLIGYSNILPSYINLADWEEEGSTYIPQFSLTATIAEPQSVNKLLGELQQQCLCYIIWDEREKLIKFRSIRPVTSLTVFDESSNIIKDSTTIAEKDSERISRIGIYYKQRNPTDSMDDVANYQSVRIGIDGDAESDSQYGEIRNSSIYSRWLTTDTQAVSLYNRLLSAYRDNPKYLSIRCDAKDRDIWTGDVIQVSTSSIQETDGAESVGIWQVIEAEEILPGEVVRYNLQSYDFYGRVCSYMADGSPDYADATEEQKQTGGWYAEDDGTIGPTQEQGYTYG